jgi:hypothetical protein
MHVSLVLILLNYGLMVWGDASTTIDPCPALPKGEKPEPIVVTEPYQAVSTCVPTASCTSGSCHGQYTYSTWQYVNTTVNVRDIKGKPTTTGVTRIDQRITFSGTKYIANVVKTMSPGQPPKRVKVVITKHFITEFKKLGRLAVPGFDSGLCKTCGEKQEVKVMECRSRRHRRPTCRTYDQVWVTAKSSASTQAPSSSMPAPPTSSSSSLSLHGAFAWGNRPDQHGGDHRPDWGHNRPDWGHGRPDSGHEGPGQWHDHPEPPDSPQPWISLSRTTATSATTTETPPAPSPLPATRPTQGGGWHDWPKPWTSTTSITSTTTTTTTMAPPPPPMTSMAGSGGWHDWPTPSNTSTTTTTTLAPPSAIFFWIQLEKEGARFQKRAPTYLTIDNGVAYTTENKNEASLFLLEAGLLMHIGFFLGVGTRTGVAPLQEFSGVQSDDYIVNDWSRNGDAVSFQPGKSILGFCVTDSLSVIVEIDSRPSYRCIGFRLIAENVDGKCWSVR